MVRFSILEAYTFRFDFYVRHYGRRCNGYSHEFLKPDIFVPHFLRLRQLRLRNNKSNILMNLTTYKMRIYIPKFFREFSE